MIIRKPVDRDQFRATNANVNYQVDIGRMGTKPFPQNFRNVSHDGRKGFDSFFAYTKRSTERDAYQAAHMPPSGTPGVLNLAVVDSDGTPIPIASFEWNGHQLLTDSRGMIKYVERDYFQTAISLENERLKYVTQMISLVAGQPSDNVVALFGWDFCRALAGTDGVDDTDPQYAHVMRVYESYLDTAGISDEIKRRKIYVFGRYANAECSPEVMCNFGDNDPEWSKAFNKLAMLIEYHPSAIIFDKGTLNPLESSGVVHGDTGHSNAGPPDEFANVRLQIRRGNPDPERYPDSNAPPLAQRNRAAPPPNAGPVFGEGFAAPAGGAAGGPNMV